MRQDRQKKPAKIIRSPSAEVRAAFERWLAIEFRAGTELVILEGLTLSGKTTLTKKPFDLDGRASTNIGMDSFLPPSIAEATPYLTAIDQSAMLDEVQKAISEAPLVILEGAIVWPALAPIVTKLGFDGVRRVYLKRMAHLMPDFWADEEFIFDREWWPPTGFHQSIYEYHAEEAPWLNSNLIIERIEERRPFKDSI
jgi:hypothetical protein